jgi:hypothetical protein
VVSWENEGVLVLLLRSVLQGILGEIVLLRIGGVLNCDMREYKMDLKVLGEVILCLNGEGGRNMEERR